MTLPPATTTHPPAARLLLSDREAAAALCVCPRTLLNLRTRHGLPFVRVGTRVMYRPPDLAAWVDARATTATASGPTGVTR